jgi:hypothetical protein
VITPGCNIDRRPPPVASEAVPPISRRSHPRSGFRAKQPKPRSWRCAKIVTQQQRCGDLLGLASWPPRSLLWSAPDQPDQGRGPGASVGGSGHNVVDPARTAPDATVGAFGVCVAAGTQRDRRPAIRCGTTPKGHRLGRAPTLRRSAATCGAQKVAERPQEPL